MTYLENVSTDSTRRTPAMAAKDWHKIQALFEEALSLEGPARDALLASTEDTQIRQELQALLSSHEDSQALAIESRFTVEGTGNGDITPRMPQADTGPYLLEKLIGEGGMGEVYLASRNDRLFEKKVAIKLIRQGIQAPEIIKRFRTERQILAQLEHPNIARLIDGGETSDGRPYLVMEYVAGQPLLQYAQRQKLSIDAQLKLFLQVCEAVQYAHLNLIVHRDLKPSNILITASGDIKLLDFGIAKLLDPAHHPQTIAVTHANMQMMTPDYAAPEQVTGDTITTATDVYALGVVLYELLSGNKPYSLAGKAAAAIERIICTEDPVRPSQAMRGTEHEGKRQQTLTGDLDNIVLKALQKEPQRRYATVDALASDIKAYLRGLPVSARADTIRYRVKKFVRRNRLAVGAAAAVFLLVLGFGVVMSFVANHVSTQADALAAQRDRSSQVTAMLIDLYRTTNPRENTIDKKTAAAMLEAGQQRILTLEDQPEVQIEFYDVLGRSYANLDLFQPALEMAEAAHQIALATHGENHPTTARTMARVADGFRLTGQPQQSLTYYHNALALQRKLLASDDPALLTTMLGTANMLRSTQQEDAAMRLAKEVDERTLATGESIHRAQALELIGMLHMIAQEPTPALASYQEAISMYGALLPEDHLDYLRAETRLAKAYIALNMPDRAKPLLQHALEKSREQLGPDHSEVSRILTAIAQQHSKEGNYSAMEAIYRDILQARIRDIGASHFITGRMHVDVGHSLLLQEKYAEAEYHLLEGMNIREAAGVSATDARALLVELYEATRQPEQAAKYRIPQNGI